jgi:hypothetical protein
MATTRWPSLNKEIKLSDTARTADEAASNAKLIALAVWSWLASHPAVLAVLFFLIGFMIG